MSANGSELFLDRNTRVRKIQQIAAFLAQIEGKDPQVRAAVTGVGTPCAEDERPFLLGDAVGENISQALFLFDFSWIFSTLTYL